MRLLKSAAQWLLRHAALYVALALAILIAPAAAQAVSRAGEQREIFQGLQAAEKELWNGYDEWEREFHQSTANLHEQADDELRRRIIATEQEINKEKAELRGDSGVVGLFRQGPTVLLTNQGRKLKIARLRREHDALTAALDLVVRRAETDELGKTMATAELRCDAATAELEALDSRWSYRLRSWMESGEHKELVRARASACGERDDLRKRLDRKESLRTAEKAYAESKQNLRQTFDSELAELSRERTAAEIRWKGTVLQKMQAQAETHHLDRVLLKALVALGVIIAMPFLIRLLFWFVLAPLAQRRAAIRLTVPGGHGKSIPPADPSTTAVSIRLAPDEELLVRQSYLQTTSHGAGNAHRWLLDWRHPVASLASGLTFLTRIRGASEVTTVSAVADPLGEVTVLTLPAGASTVLQPRALAAVVQPVGRPVRLTSHWRIRSLNAWLTMQLRYMVFHGPCRLVIKGGRGVRVERADRGRIFGQAQLLGFSADLSYAVTKTETFWPYFLGRQQLLKDKVHAGDGVLIIEEAPMGGRKSRARRRGLEDAVEVVSKALGI